MAQACLFDLDGTLIDSIGLIRSSWGHTLRVHLGREADEQEWLMGLGRPLAWHFAQLVSDPAEVQRMIATYREHNLAHHDRMVRAYPGAVAAVEALAARGARLAVVTSKLRSGAERGLAQAGLAGLFELVIGADDCRRHKPDPEPVQRALEALGIAPENAVFAGDSPHDLAAGRAAGVRTAAVTWGPFPRELLQAEAPDLWLESAADFAYLADPPGAR